MKVTIQVECETISDFYSHLSELRRQIRKEVTRLKLSPIVDEFTGDVDLYDANCYGEHCVYFHNEEFEFPDYAVPEQAEGQEG